jgi:hypothetical protein
MVTVIASLEDVVPDSDRSPTAGNGRRGIFNEKLRDSRQTTGPELRGNVVAATVTYTAPHAEFTDTGPDPHQIPTGGRDVQLAKGYPMRFFLAGVGDVFAYEVFWQPGAGVEANRGWFHRGLDVWSDALQAATDAVSS